MFEAVLRYEAGRHGADVPCEQTPGNLYFVADILSAFPEARIVVMVRDPRAVLLSQKRKWRRRQLGEQHLPRREAVRAWLNYHPAVTSNLWASASRAGRQAAAQPRVTTVRYEALLREPRPVVRDLCAFLDLDDAVDMLDVPVASSSLQADTSERGLRSERAQAWRRGGLGRTELFLCQRICEAEMRHHGYDALPIRPTAPGLLGLAVSLPLKLMPALVLNRRMLGSLIAAIRRRLRPGP